MVPVKPNIISFLIADMVIQEQVTNKWSAIGIFDRIISPNFPYIHPGLSLYLRLSDAEGDYNIRVEFCDNEDRRLALFEGIKVSIASRLVSVDFGIKTNGLPIPKPGNYCFNLYFNEEFAESFPLKVEQYKKV